MTAAPTVLLLTDDLMGSDAHAAPGQPERPERARAAADGVVAGAEAAGADARAARGRRRPRMTSSSASIPAWFLAALDAAASRGGGWIDADTYLSPGSMQVSRLAAGATLAAARAAAVGEAAVAFAVVRPPGHHAFEEQTHGFCLLNNVAIAVAGLRAEGLAQRIAVVDWDVHHGDGTQAIFDADRGPVLRLDPPVAASTPGRAAPRSGAPAPPSAPSTTSPLPAGSGDRAFTEAWTVQLLPAIEAFAPEAILVSAGYDAHRLDPLADARGDGGGLPGSGHALGELAARLGLRGVALTLEGGYDLDALRGQRRGHGAWPPRGPDRVS